MVASFGVLKTKKRRSHFVAKISHDTSDLLARISTQNQS
jgi:hypothetical protein